MDRFTLAPIAALALLATIASGALAVAPKNPAAPKDTDG
jgi:hypothetical protein